MKLFLHIITRFFTVGAIVTICSVCQAQASTYVYVSNAKSHSIDVFAVDSTTFELTKIHSVAIQSPAIAGFSAPMALSKKRAELWVATRGTPNALARFTINTNSGKLTPKSGHNGESELPYSYAYIGLDHQENLLIGASYSDNLASVFSISENEKLQEQQVLKGYPNAHAVAYSPNNQEAWITALGANKVYRFPLAKSLRDINTQDPEYVQFPEKSGPRHIAVHPNGKHVYVIGEYDAKVYVIDAAKPLLNNAKAIIQVLSIPFNLSNTQPKAADIKITQNGDFVFATERKTNSLCSFSVNSKTGLLALVDCIQTETWPRAIQIDHTHNLLVAAGKKSDHISVYKIKKDGRLTLLDRYETGVEPNWIETVSFN